MRNFNYNLPMSINAWLLEGDVSIQYMTHRFLLGSDDATLSQLQSRIASEGFGSEFLSRQNANGHWGLYYYQPKWTSTHYTLLDLKDLFAPRTLKPCRVIVTRMFNECMNGDGGMNLSKYEHPSDICVDGMVLNYAAYFCEDEPRITKLVDHLLSVQKQDGGFTWDINSDNGEPHTTICVLEGLEEFCCSGKVHKIGEIEAAKGKAVEFLLSNRLFFDNSDKRFLKLSYPYRYRYDLLRVLEYFARSHTPYNIRMQPALDWLKEKRKNDGLWYLENQHKGNVHFSMEEPGNPSRFITFKALNIIKYFFLQSLQSPKYAANCSMDTMGQSHCVIPQQ